MCSVWNESHIQAERSVEATLQPQSAGLFGGFGL